MVDMQGMQTCDHLCNYSLRRKHTCDPDVITSLDFFGWVGALTVILSLVLSSDVVDLVVSFQCLEGVSAQKGLVFVVPGEVDGWGATLNGAHQSHALPLRDAPHAGGNAQHWS